MKKLITIFTLLISFYSNVLGQIVINEISNANGSTFYDQEGDTEDWIELYNNGSSSVNLLNYGITDDDTELNKFIFPSISIASHSYLLLLASEKKSTSQQIHLNFKLDPDGEKVTLSDPAGKIIDSYSVGRLQCNHSIGRNPNGSANWCLFDDATPKASNNSSACYDGYEPEPVLSLAGGAYNSNQTVSITPGSSTSVIRYTTNGGFPNSGSNLYSSPLTINKTQVVSAKSYSTVNRLPSNTVSYTYLINETGLDLPVVSISVKPADLWDFNTGIYVDGPNISSVFPYFGANYWEDWERRCHVEYFDKQKNKKFELDAELKIHGGYSRTHPQKSFRINCHSYYGTSKIKYPLIPEKNFISSYESFTLRNGGSDGYGTRFRDAFMQRVMKGINADINGYEPAIVFLNGEYWGEYEIREKQDEEYIESNFGVPKDKVDLLAHSGNLKVKAGSDTSFYTMHDFISTANSQSSTYYANAAKLLNIENFTDYFIAQTYYSNRDWIRDSGGINNIKLWHSQLPGGKWRYVFWDLDQGSGWKNQDVNRNSLTHAINPPTPNPHSDILRNLLGNTQFHNYFINRYADLINTIYQHDNLKTIAFAMRDSIDPAMPRHEVKWPDDDYDKWYNSVDDMIDWLKLRKSVVRQHIETEFNLNEQVDVTLDVFPVGAGKIKISTIIPENLPWTGVYFDGVPVTINAIPNPGYTFQYWASNSVLANPDSNQSITLNIKTDAEFTAYFLTSTVTVPELNNLAFQLSISPNPSKGEVIINIKGEEKLENLSFELYNELGQIVMQKNSLKEQQIILNKNEFGAGVFIVKVSNGKSIVTEKWSFID